MVHIHSALGINRVALLTVGRSFLELLDESERRECLDVDPALEDVVDPVKKSPAFHPERSVPCIPTTDAFDSAYFHGAASNLERAKLDVVIESLSDAERHAHRARWRNDLRRRRLQLRRDENRSCRRERRSEYK